MNTNLSAAYVMISYTMLKRTNRHPRPRATDLISEIHTLTDKLRDIDSSAFQDTLSAAHVALEGLKQHALRTPWNINMMLAVTLEARIDWLSDPYDEVAIQRGLNTIKVAAESFKIQLTPDTPPDPRGKLAQIIRIVDELNEAKEQAALRTTNDN